MSFACRTHPSVLAQHRLSPRWTLQFQRFLWQDRIPRLGNITDRHAFAYAGATITLAATAAALAAQHRRMTAGKAESPSSGLCNKQAELIEHPVTGCEPGPYPVGVTTIQFDDHSRTDPDGGPRGLQTEIWYPATQDSKMLPLNRYSDFLARGVIPGCIDRAEDPDAIGGYRQGLKIKELDLCWQNLARRDAQICSPEEGELWPIVVFSHGSGAFRASYVYFTEFLASHGFVVVACDHVGSSRYTIINGKVVKGGGHRGEASQEDRPKDVIFLLDQMQRMHFGCDSRFTGRLDLSRCAVAGMSFGGWTVAKVLEMNDPRIRVGVLQCPSLARGTLGNSSITAPVMIMLGAQDTVIGAQGIKLCHDYFAATSGPCYLVEVFKAGHVSFSSCEQYNIAYGNGIGTSRSLTSPGDVYEPINPGKMHAMVNLYTLAFLDEHLRYKVDQHSFLNANQFPSEISYKCRK